MRWVIGIGLCALVLMAGVRLWQTTEIKLPPSINPNAYTVEVTDYKPPAQEPDELFVDDNPNDKKPKFDPELVDSRLAGVWELNLSEALIRLDAPMLLPDQDGELLKLSPSYATTIKNHLKQHPYGTPILPSINMIDGKAKQFDDGLYAALDLAYYQGVDKVFVSHVDFVKRLQAKIGADSPASPFLAAGLELVGIKVEVADRSAKEAYLTKFKGDQVRSKPIGFYTWTPKLEELFIFLRFFQDKLPKPSADALAAALRSDEGLRADYARLIGFFSKLTNPRAGASLLDLVKDPAFPRPVWFLPPAVTKEGRLFEALFPMGLPPGTNLMREMVKAIKSGKVQLEPKPDAGWYDYQVYALETMLLPEKGAEFNKLVLTKTYKKRMLEAFQALITKRKETHVRDSMIPLAASAPPPSKIKPRLRIEPAPTYYLRTARAYGFLANFLESTLGAAELKKLHGLKQGGTRSKDLMTELTEMRELFLGCYLLSCEDLGMKPDFLKDEQVDKAKCVKTAEAWLKSAADDPDLAIDTRVIVPVYQDLGSVKCWGTMGVRLAKMNASFATSPSMREAKKKGDWKKPEPHTLESAEYLIPVDEFAEVSLSGNRVLTRDEFRAICDEQKTKEKIVEALGR